MCAFFNRSVVPSAKRTKVQSYSLKVTFASLVGGKIQNPTRQVYVLITEETANTNDIKSLCAEQLGVDTISLVTANGLPIGDSDGTRGNF